MVQPVRRVEGEGLWLVPYESEHVPRYHAWLQDAQLLQATASDPLSLAEHYELQQSWSSDRSTMAGDVNIFINDLDDQHTAELDIMIAEPLSRGKGLAKDAIRLMMEYASEQFQISKFRVKIEDSNDPSLHLFRKLVHNTTQTAAMTGFHDVSYSEVFKQVTLELFHGINQKGTGL